MAVQEDIFRNTEGDAWFTRNKAAFDQLGKMDWPCQMLDLLDTPIDSVAELGCANGWRLERLRERVRGRVAGVDASAAAIEDGKSRYPLLDLHRGVLSDVPLKDPFDLIIVHFVLHWVDRAMLARSISEIDRLVKDGGYLILGDFLPDFPQRRRYHHLPQEQVYTYKQDYARIFEALGIYKEIGRAAFDHDAREPRIQAADSHSRGVCVVLKKSSHGFYAELP